MAACGGGGGGGGGTKLPSGHSNLQSIIEAEGYMHTDPEGAMAFFRSFGINRVRVYVWWGGADEGISPNPTSRHAPRGFVGSQPSDYRAARWAIYDKIVRAAAKEHVGVDLTLGPPAPLWAAGRGAPRHAADAADWMPSAVDFGRFVHAVGVRYSGHYKPPGAKSKLPRVNFWSIWNEPNYGPYLAPQAIHNSTIEVAPRLYRALVDAAWSALAATGHTGARDTILIGETAPRAPNHEPANFNGTVPLQFLRAFYCVDAKFKPLQGVAATERGCPATAAASAQFPAQNPALFRAGGFADHPYPDASAPTVVTPPPTGLGYADFAALAQLEDTLDRAAAAYHRTVRLPIYSTEFGYRTNPPNPQYGIPLKTAASYLNESEYLSWRNPRILSYDQYLLWDPPAYEHTAFDSGLDFASEAPKPYVYDAFRMPLWLPVTRAPSGKPLVVWGCVRPAPVIKRRRSHVVMIQFARTGGAFKTVRKVTLSGPSCYFETAVKFPGAGTVRLAWSGSGPTIYSRSQSISQ